MKWLSQFVAGREQPGARAEKESAKSDVRLTETQDKRKLCARDLLASEVLDGDKLKDSCIELTELGPKWQGIQSRRFARSAGPRGRQETGD